MTNTATATRGMVVAPHHLAAQSGLAILREGGNAIEAMVAAAATIAVVYPHMNAIGGDGFWIVHAPGSGTPIAIDACGAAAAAGHPRVVPGAGTSTRSRLAVPSRPTPWRARCPDGRRPSRSAGAGAARAPARTPAGRCHPLRRAGRSGHREPAHQYPRTSSSDLEAVPGFAEQFLPGGAVPAVGDRFVNERLGRTLPAARAGRARLVLPRSARGRDRRGSHTRRQPALRRRPGAPPGRR